MKLYTLMENTSACPELTAEHGLSLYLETEKHRILFDAGHSGAFAENAQRMGVRLETVDFAVLSHGHYDHGGGLGTFLEQNKTAPVYIQKQAFGHFLNRSGKYIGLDRTQLDWNRIILTEDVQQLAPGITLFSCNEKHGQYPVDSDCMQIQTENGLQPDTFRHEQYLLIEEAGKRILISGCSHKGILNIAEWFRPDVLVGGFHFMKQEPSSAMVTAAARKLLEYQTQYYTGHCTGQAQYAAMKAIMGEQLEALSTGRVLEL